MHQHQTSAADEQLDAATTQAFAHDARKDAAGQLQGQLRKAIMLRPSIRQC
jgi:hypothetical protein